MGPVLVSRADFLMLRLFRQYYPIRNLFFVAGEGLVIYASFLLASLALQGPSVVEKDPWIALKSLLITLVCQACLYYNDLYDLKVTDTLKELTIRLVQSLGFAAVILALVYVLFPRTEVSTATFAVSVGLVVLLVASWRFGYSIVLQRGLFNQKIMLLGSGGLTGSIEKEIRERVDCGYSVALEVPECVDDVDFSKPSGVRRICRENFEGLCELAKAFEVEKIVVAFKERRRALPTAELLRCRMEGIDVLEGNTFYEMLTGKFLVGQINPSWLIFSGGFQKSRARRFIKRTTDLIFSVVIMAVLSPFLLLVAGLIKLDSPGRVFFSQERVGERRRIYNVLKFRSMVADAEKISGPVWAQENDPRVTRLGRCLRRLRIDELPQLWNVVKGEMSFVGPRPEREVFIKELEQKIPYYGERFYVKPGITGWAQINYGYGASVEDAVEKLNYDLFYIKNMSTMMDILIVVKTLKIVIFGRGVR